MRKNNSIKEVYAGRSTSLTTETDSGRSVESATKFFFAGLIFLLVFHGVTWNVNSQFLHKLDRELKPWTSEPVIGESYRFVIIGDLTGGEIPGAFDSAVERINMLAPEFVISVGDLIEGYTVDRGLIGEYWDRFNNSLKNLEAPFFYVPGNHDVINPVLLDEWIKRYGYDYYSFYAGNVLFIVINTEVPGAKVFPQDQVDYLRGVLNDHPEGDPVFVFSHMPLFAAFEREGYSELEQLLKDRDVTYFGGHWHRYIHATRNNQPHYVLAGTASGRTRNVDLGRFFNIMFVTVTPERVTLANLDLEGFVPLSIVDEETMPLVNAIGSNWAVIKPTVMKTEEGVWFASTLTLHNRGGYPLQITGGFNPAGNFILEPEKVEVILPPNSSKDIPVSLNTIKPHPVKYLPEIEMQLHGKFLQEGKNITASNSAGWLIDNWKRSKNKSTDPPFTERLIPGAVQNGWTWNGIDDGTFSYRVMHDNDHVYIDVVTFDDKVIFGEEYDNQDKLIILFNPDTTFRNNDYARFEFIPGQRDDIVLPSDERYSSIGAGYRLDGNSIKGSLKVPRSLLEGNYYRLNFAFMDVDDPRPLHHSVLWWKPSWGTPGDYPRSGVVIIED